MSLFTFIAPQESGLAHTLPVSCVTDSENPDTCIWYEKLMSLVGLLLLILLKITTLG